jgi:hypothetical protein
MQRRSSAAEAHDHLFGGEIDLVSKGRYSCTGTACSNIAQAEGVPRG